MHCLLDAHVVFHDMRLLDHYFFRHLLSFEELTQVLKEEISVCYVLEIEATISVLCVNREPSVITPTTFCCSFTTISNLTPCLTSRLNTSGSGVSGATVAGSLDIRSRTCRIDVAGRTIITAQGASFATLRAVSPVVRLQGRS